MLLSSFLINCSGSASINEENTDDKKQLLTPDQQKQKALEFFINGGVFETQGNYKSAAAEYEKALLYDSTAGLYYTLAKNYVYLNKLPLALNYSQKALKLDSSEIDYYDLLADIYNYGNKTDSAIVTLEKAIKIDSTNIELNYKLARLYENDKPLKAVKLYSRILYQLGPDWSVLTRIAELQERLGNNDEAIGALKKLLAIDPANIPLKKMLIEFNLKAKKYDDGILLADEILELMPDDLETREAKAKLLLGKNDWEGASKEFDYILDQPNVNFDAKN